MGRTQGKVSGHQDSEVERVYQGTAGRRRLWVVRSIMRSVFIWRQTVTVKSTVREARKQVDLITGKDCCGCSRWERELQKYEGYFSWEIKVQVT